MREVEHKRRKRGVGKHFDAEVGVDMSMDWFEREVVGKESGSPASYCCWRHWVEGELGGIGRCLGRSPEKRG